MAQTSAAVQLLEGNSAEVLTLTTIVQADGHKATGADRNRPGPLMLHVTNTGTAANCTVKGANGQPDLDIAVPATTGVVDTPLYDDHRFLQDDGSYLFTFGAGFAGKIAVYRAKSFKGV